MSATSKPARRHHLLALCGLALAAPATALGQWSAVYSIQRTGLHRSVHTGSLGLQTSRIVGISPAGIVTGTTNRYEGIDASNGEDAWIWNGTATIQLGFTGGPYTGATGFQMSQVGAPNELGQALGISRRLRNINTSNGQDAWIWNGTTTIRLGLTGPGYTGSEGYQASDAWLPIVAGRVVGTSARISGVDTQVGVSAWIWDGTTTTPLGLTGPAYTGSEGYQLSQPWFLGATGNVVGTSTRYIDVDEQIGQDTWVWDGTTTTQIGLTGDGYVGSQGFQHSMPRFQSASGQVAGISNRIQNDANNGIGAWIWNGTSTIQIGLTGPANTGSTGYQLSEPHFQNASGQVTGISKRYIGDNANNGQDTWVWNGTTTIQIGLEGPEHTSSTGFQISLPWFQNDAGHIAGYQDRLIPGTNTTRGANTWVWNGTTTTKIGLVDSAHTGSSGIQSSELFFQNAGGHIVGTSNRYLNVLTMNGFDTWVWNGTTTTQIGLTGGVHTGSGGYQLSRPRALNSAGRIVGYSNRYTGLNTAIGQDAWYFDPVTGVSSPMIVSVRTSDNFAYSDATITDNGVALGLYKYFANGQGDGEFRAFVFSPDRGFTDLGALVNGGLSASGWSKLTSATSPNDLTSIVGYGLASGQTSGQSVFVMTETFLCPADVDNGSNTGTRDNAVDISDLLYYLLIFESGAANADLDNGTGTGAPDGAVEISDLLYFLVRFDAGC